MEGRWGEWLRERALMSLSFLTFQESKKLKFRDSIILPAHFPSLTLTWLRWMTPLFIWESPFSAYGRKGPVKSDRSKTTPLILTHPFIPGPQLILTSPDKVAKLLVVRVVVMLDSEQHWGWDFHQRVVGSLLLLATCVPIVQIVDLVCYLWRGRSAGTDHWTAGKSEDGNMPCSKKGTFMLEFTCAVSKGRQTLIPSWTSLTSWVQFSYLSAENNEVYFGDVLGGQN